MKHALLAATALVCGLAIGRPAHAAFIDGYLARCTATSTGTCTEMTTSGYARVPVAFNLVPQRNGSNLVANATNYSFGGTGTVAGHAVYDAPTGGNLLFVIPLATAGSATGAVQTREAGNMQFTLAALPAAPAANILSLAGAATVGASTDGSAVSTGIPLMIDRGVVRPVPFGVTFANLPAPAAAQKGRENVFCSDCRKPGEAAGAGTGMPVFDNGTAWYSFAGTAAAN